jgi:hypothetical protein
MLSKKTKKKISKVKRTTKRYLTKIGIRKPRRNPDALMPFIWNTNLDTKSKLDAGLRSNKYYVIIATYKYKPLYDPFLLGTEKGRFTYVLVPDIDQIKSQIEFERESDALEFIKVWWAKQ